MKVVIGRATFVSEKTSVARRKTIAYPGNVKESLKVSGNKDDNIDALAIAKYLKNNSSQSRVLMFNSPELERLKTLV